MDQGWLTYLQKTNSTLGSGRRVNEAGTMGRAGEKSKVEMQEKREEGSGGDHHDGLPTWFRSLFGRKLSGLVKLVTSSLSAFF